MPSIILSDNGVSSGSAGLKSTAASDGALALQTTTAGGTATTAVYVDTSQNVGLGTSSPVQKQHLDGGAGDTYLQFSNSTTGATSSDGSRIGIASADTTLRIQNLESGSIRFDTAGSERMRLDASGNLGVGTTSPASTTGGKVLEVYNGGVASTSADNSEVRVRSASRYATLSLTAKNDKASIIYFGDNDNDSIGQILYDHTNNAMSFNTSAAERARIDSSGNLLVGRTSGAGSEKLGVLQSAADWAGNFVNGYSGTYYVIRANSTSTQNNTSSIIYDGLDNNSLRFRVYANGGIANFSANNSNLSDIREKKDIELAGSYLAKICAIPVKTFLYNDQTDTDKNLGVIAQDVQAVAPELVAETDWAGEGEEPKMRLSIYQTDLQYALMKCIQELKAELDTAKAEIAALKGTQP